jgi:hypothetical protein
VLRVLLAWPAKLRATSRQQAQPLPARLRSAESAEVTQLRLVAKKKRK